METKSINPFFNKETLISDILYYLKISAGLNDMRFNKNKTEELLNNIDLKDLIAKAPKVVAIMDVVRKFNSLIMFHPEKVKYENDENDNEPIIYRVKLDNPWSPYLYFNGENLSILYEDDKVTPKISKIIPIEKLSIDDLDTLKSELIDLSLPF